MLGLAVLAGWALWAMALRDEILRIHPHLEQLSGIFARLVFWILPSAVYLCIVWKKDWARPLGLDFPLGFPQVLRTFAVTSVVAVFLMLSTATHVNASPLQILHTLCTRASSGWSAPIFEELVFRGVFLSELLTWTHESGPGLRQLRTRYWLSQCGAAALFTLVHWPYWLSHRGIGAALSLSGPIFVTGLVLGFVFAHTRSLWGCMLLHWLNNQLSIIR